MCSNHNNSTHHLHIKERKTRIVVLISIAAMLLEITFGYITNSMALLSDGWHMSSHVIAIGAGWLTYKYVINKQATNHLKSNPDKIFSLTGYTNGLVLLVIAAVMLVESFQRLRSPLNVSYREAILVSIFGLVINLISAKVLHHKEAHSDNNIKATYLHVMADVLTSVFALVALFAGLYYRIYWLDSIMGVVGSVIIMTWSWGLIKNSWKDLVKSIAIDPKKLKRVNPTQF